jgi:hypothetical protein
VFASLHAFGGSDTIACQLDERPHNLIEGTPNWIANAAHADRIQNAKIPARATPIMSSSEKGYSRHGAAGGEGVRIETKCAQIKANDSVKAK